MYAWAKLGGAVEGGWGSERREKMWLVGCQELCLTTQETTTTTEPGESGVGVWMNVCVFTLVIRHIFNFPWEIWWVLRASVFVVVTLWECVCVLLYFHYSTVLLYRGVSGKQVELHTSERESRHRNASDTRTHTHQLISSTKALFTCQQSRCSMRWGSNKFSEVWMEIRATAERSTVMSAFD